MSAQLNNEQATILREFFKARKAAGDWKKIADAKREELDEALGINDLTESNEYAGEAGEYIGRVRLVPGKRLDGKRLKAERPDVYAQFEVETEQIRIEEPS